MLKSGALARLPGICTSTTVPSNVCCAKRVCRAQARYAAHALTPTNKPFAEWSEVFPNAACVVSLVDRLVHHSEVISIEGASYRLKEAKEKSEQLGNHRRKKSS